MADYRLEPQYKNFAVQLYCDDLEALLIDSNHRRELVALLDQYMVLHIRPKRPLTKQLVGELGFLFDYPKSRRNPRNIPPEKSSAIGYEFVGDFSAKARPNLPAPRIPSYIGSLHYDGISRCSIYAGIDAALTTPNLWADMRAAYNDLSIDMRRIIDQRFALHAVVPPPNTPLEEFPDFDSKTAIPRPLVIKHHRTGDPLLYLPKNPASKIAGMDDKEGRDILHELWAHVNTLPTRYASTLNNNEVVVWDGLGTTHTNPSYPRDKDRTSWFFIVPAASEQLEHYYA